MSNKPNFIGFSSEYKADDGASYYSLLDEQKLNSQLKELKTLAIKNRKLHADIVLKINDDADKALAVLRETAPIEKKMAIVLDAVKDISNSTARSEFTPIIRNVTVEILESAKRIESIEIQDQLADIAAQIKL